MELDLHKYTEQNRFRHRYVLGQTGTGKSTLLLNFAIKDILSGHGVFFLDFHGEDSLTLLSHVPKEKAGDVIFFDPANSTTPINVLENVAQSDHARTASAQLDMFKSLWDYTTPTPVLDENVRNGVAALLDHPGATLLGLHFLFLSKKYRSIVEGTITDPIVQDYWRRFETILPKNLSAKIDSTVNKTGFLMGDPRIRRTFGSSRSVFSMSDVLDGKILIVRLPQGQLGLHTAKMIASLLLSNLHGQALARISRKPFHVYLDEIQNLCSSSLIEMLSGIRKFGVSLTLAHQYMDQLDRGLRDAVLGNVGTKFMFRIGYADTGALRYTEFGVQGHNVSLAEMRNQLVRVSTPPDGVVELHTPKLPGAQPASVQERILEGNRRFLARSNCKIDAEISRFIKNST